MPMWQSTTITATFHLLC